MSIMTIETTITRKYLFGKSKSDLAYMYLELLERAVQAEAERDALVIEREQLLKRAAAAGTRGGNSSVRIARKRAASVRSANRAA